ncbi:MAG: beta-N-acetylglucosaminidase domain-containing protein, partial [Pseudolysinimonas sp.]
MLSFIGGLGMNLYVYAPKDDPFHRARWREPYPADAAGLLRELATAAAGAGVEFVYALHPGLDLDPASDSDHAALGRKTRELHAQGVRRFALLFDDIPLDDAEALGRAHGETCARYEAEVLAPLGIGDTLLMVPTDYAGSGATAYRDGLSATLPPTTGVFWTGDDIVVGAVTAEQARGAKAAFGGRPLLLWDNFPVNDFDRSRAFLGPLLGRDPELDDVLAGIVANPLVEYEPSRFALHTVAEWARDPRGYDASAAAERALVAVAGTDAAVLRPLVAAASSWPPSA